VEGGERGLRCVRAKSTMVVDSKKGQHGLAVVATGVSPFSPRPFPVLAPFSSATHSIDSSGVT
jgi:hypothetical protein